MSDDDLTIRTVVRNVMLLRSSAEHDRRTTPKKHRNTQSSGRSRRSSRNSFTNTLSATPNLSLSAKSLVGRAIRELKDVPDSVERNNESIAPSTSMDLSGRGSNLRSRRSSLPQLSIPFEDAEEGGSWSLPTPPAGPVTRSADRRKKANHLQNFAKGLETVHQKKDSANGSLHQESDRILRSGPTRRKTKKVFGVQDFEDGLQNMLQSKESRKSGKSVLQSNQVGTGKKAINESERNVNIQEDKRAEENKKQSPGQLKIVNDSLTPRNSKNSFNVSSSIRATPQHQSPNKSRRSGQEQVLSAVIPNVEDGTDLILASSNNANHTKDSDGSFQNRYPLRSTIEIVKNASVNEDSRNEEAFAKAESSVNFKEKDISQKSLRHSESYTNRSPGESVQNAYPLRSTIDIMKNASVKESSRIQISFEKAKSSVVDKEKDISQTSLRSLEVSTNKSNVKSPVQSFENTYALRSTVDSMKNASVNESSRNPETLEKAKSSFVYKEKGISRTSLRNSEFSTNKSIVKSPVQSFDNTYPSRSAIDIVKNASVNESSRNPDISEMARSSVVDEEKNTSQSSIRNSESPTNKSIVKSPILILQKLPLSRSMGSGNENSEYGVVETEKETRMTNETDIFLSLTNNNSNVQTSAQSSPRRSLSRKTSIGNNLRNTSLDNIIRNDKVSPAVTGKEKMTPSKTESISQQSNNDSNIHNSVRNLQKHSLSRSRTVNLRNTLSNSHNTIDNTLNTVAEKGNESINLSVRDSISTFSNTKRNFQNRVRNLSLLRNRSNNPKSDSLNNSSTSKKAFKDNEIPVEKGEEVIQISDAVELPKSPNRGVSDFGDNQLASTGFHRSILDIAEEPVEKQKRSLEQNGEENDLIGTRIRSPDQDVENSELDMDNMLSDDQIHLKKSNEKRKPRKIQNADVTRTLKKFCQPRFCLRSRYPVHNNSINTVVQGLTKLLEVVTEDAKNSAAAAGRKKFLYPSDINLYMKRNGYITETCSRDFLITKFMPYDLQWKMIPHATAYNVIKNKLI